MSSSQAPGPRVARPSIASVASIALLLALGVAAATPGAARAQLPFGAPCALLVTRAYEGAERQGTVDWGNTLVVHSTIRIDCRGAFEPFDQARVALTLPEGMTAFRVVEEDADGNDVARGIDPPQAALSFDVALDRDGGWTLFERWIHVHVRPVAEEVDALGELRVGWDDRVAVQAPGRPWTELEPVPMQALVVRRARADAGCVVDADRTYGAVAPDGTVTATLRLRASRCRPFMPRVQAMLAFPPPRSTDEGTRTVTAARGFQARLGPDDADIGALVGYASGARVVRPQPDPDAVIDLLYDLGPGPAADAETMLRGALAALDPPALNHGVVWVVGRADAPVTAPGAFDLVVGQAVRRGIEVVTACVGGGCDPAVAWRYAYADLAALRFAWLGGVVDAHRGAPYALAALRVEETLEDATLVPGSARIDGAAAPPVVVDGRPSWTIPLGVGQAAALTYTLVTTGPSGARFTGRGTVRGVYDDGAARAEGGAVRLPRAVLTRSGPPPALAECAPPTTRAVAPASVLVGEVFDVRLGVRTACADALRRSDVVVLLDGSRAGARAGALSAQLALRRLLWALESPETHVALMVFDRQVTRRIPLSRNYLGVHDLLNDFGTLWYDRFFKGQLEVGLLAALDELADRRRDAEARVVLMTGGEGDPAAYVPAARRLEAQGARISVFCSPPGCAPEIAEVASDPRDYRVVSEDASNLALFDEVGATLRALRVTRAAVTETIAAGLRVEPGSIHPASARADERSIAWREDGPALPIDLDLGYRATAQGAGAVELAPGSEAAVFDERGRAGRAPFPRATVKVYAPGDAGPCTPHLTREPARVVAARAAVVTTTLRARLDCPARKAPLDVVLAIDHSDSMRFADRLANAVAAAGAFLDGLDPAEVRVGLVAFGSDVTVNIPLTDEYAIVRAALARLEPGGQTAIARAIQAAGTLLDARRADVLPALVLLTDGQESSGNPATMLDAAQRLKDGGVTIAAVCAGTCDAELAQVASDPTLAFDVADSAQLVGLYTTLADRFGRARPRQIHVVDAYDPRVRPVEDASAPAPDAVTPDQAEWTLSVLPDGGLEIAVAMVPAVEGGAFRPIRFARLGYVYGTGPDAVGQAYFPPIELEVEPGPTPLASPTPGVLPTPTTRPEARFVYLPWGHR